MFLIINSRIIAVIILLLTSLCKALSFKIMLFIGLCLRRLLNIAAAYWLKLTVGHRSTEPNYTCFLEILFVWVLMGKSWYSGITGMPQDSWIHGEFWAVIRYGRSSAIVSACTKSTVLDKTSLMLYTETRDELLETAGEVFANIASGVLRVRVNHTYHLSDAAQAHADLESRKTSGSVVLIPWSKCLFTSYTGLFLWGSYSGWTFFVLACVW